MKWQGHSLFWNGGWGAWFSASHWLVCIHNTIQLHTLNDQRHRSTDSQPEAHLSLLRTCGAFEDGSEKHVAPCEKTKKTIVTNDFSARSRGHFEAEIMLVRRQVDCFYMFSEWIGQLFIIMGMAFLFSEPGHLTQLTKKRQQIAVHSLDNSATSFRIYYNFCLSLPF